MRDRPTFMQLTPFDILLIAQPQISMNHMTSSHIFSASETHSRSRLLAYLTSSCSLYTPLCVASHRVGLKSSYSPYYIAQAENRRLHTRVCRFSYISVRLVRFKRETGRDSSAFDRAYMLTAKATLRFSVLYTLVKFY
jgi:hypothetical protein